MKSLGKTIDRLIAVDSNLEKVLKPIKNKWKRYPRKTMDYWKELLAFLNTDALRYHPKRMKMHGIINPVDERKRPLYSFEQLSSHDTVIGLIPGNLADKIRQQDLQSIRIAKEHLEADMTHSRDLMAQVIRKEQILEIKTKKLWIDLRDHFNLWDRPGNYNVKILKNILYIAEQSTPPQFMGSGVVKMNPDMLKKFLDYMGMEPPPGLFGGNK